MQEITHVLYARTHVSNQPASTLDMLDKQQDIELKIYHELKMINVTL